MQSVHNLQPAVSTEYEYSVNLYLSLPFSVKSELGQRFEDI